MFGTRAEQAAGTLFNVTSAALVNNAWWELQRRGVEVTATRQPNWTWWSSAEGGEQVQQQRDGRTRWHAEKVVASTSQTDAAMFEMLPAVKHAWFRARVPSETHILTSACVLQNTAVPADHSVISLMLQTTNKETGAGLTDMQVVAQSNVFIAAGVLQHSRHCALPDDHLVSEVRTLSHARDDCT